MSIVFGLDFGTANSALSVNIDGKVHLLDIDKDNPVGMTLKSVLYFYNEDQERNIYAGHEAVQNYIDTGGEGRFLQSIKSFLPDATFEKTEIYKKNYTIEELIALILKKIKERGEEIIGSSVNDLVIGRPVVFSEEKENDELAERRLIEAAKIAGFKNINLQLEPIAAALNFENSFKSNEEIKNCVNSVLSQAGLTNKDIDLVSLTGGSSFIPIIYKIFTETFGIEKINQSDAFTSVAYGLGVYSTMI